MPDPVFSPDERVDTPQALPSELVTKLQGKSAAEQASLIIDYYSKREKAVIAQAKEAIRTQDPTKVPGHEKGTTVRTERTDLNQSTTVNQPELDGARATLIAAAKVQAARDKKYWDRFLPDVEKIMAGMTPEFQVDFRYWETAYYNLVGQNKAKLDQEDKDAEANAARLTAERASAGHETPEVLEPLPPTVTGKILPGLGITEAQYRTGQKNIAEGKWPLTFDKAAR
jgi:hypothetical protein